MGQESRPSHAAFAVKFEDRWYCIRDAARDDHPLGPWNQGTFRVLAQLYQMTVTGMSKAPAPAITIAQ